MTDKNAIKKLLLLFKPYKRSIIILMYFLIISTILNFFIPLFQKKIMDDGFLNNDFKIVLLYTIISFILVCIDKLLSIFKEIKRADIYSKIAYSLQEIAYKHISKLNIEYFNNTNYAELLNNINLDVQNISTVANESVLFVITQIFGMIGGIVGLIIIDWRLTIIVLCFIPAKYLTIKYFAKQRKKMQDQYIKNCSCFAKWFGDTVAGIKEVRLFNILDNKLEEFGQKQFNVVNIGKKISILDSKNRALEEMLVQLMLMSINIVGANLIFNLQLTVGSIFAFITYSRYVTTPISTILNIGYIISGIIPSTKRFYSFLDLKEEQDKIINKSRKEDDREYGIIRFKNVYFSYLDDKPVLKNINLSIAPKEKVAFIGLNGSGKSTIIDLILRFYKPNSGEITFNGINIEDFDIQEYRNYISVVSQQVYLFDESIKHNIKLYSNVSDGIVDKAIEDSQLSKFMTCIDSYDFNVGQNGNMLSGGQKQKIALARALIQDRPILIFDEATSNLDAESEMNINKLLDTRLKDKMVIIITHRLDILKHIDKIILIDHGEIKQIGTHDELYKNSGLYRNMIDINNK